MGESTDAQAKETETTVVMFEEDLYKREKPGMLTAEKAGEILLVALACLFMLIAIGITMLAGVGLYCITGGR